MAWLLLINIRRTRVACTRPVSTLTSSGGGHPRWLLGILLETDSLASQRFLESLIQLLQLAVQSAVWDEVSNLRAAAAGEIWNLVRTVTPVAGFADLTGRA